MIWIPKFTHFTPPLLYITFGEFVGLCDKAMLLASPLARAIGHINRLTATVLVCVTSHSSPLPSVCVRESKSHFICNDCALNITRPTSMCYTVGYKPPCYTF